MSAQLNEPRWRFPEKMGGLFRPSRFKVLYGGRDSAKSWSIARALLLEGAEKPLPVGCFREVQKSIKDSVHQLLSNQVEELGLTRFYDIMRDEIRGENGTYFRYAGLSTQTRDSMKSWEGLMRAWVEEAQTVSKRSWDILEPTIRADGSELWISFNPEMESDETYQRFVVHPSGEVWSAFVNWNDNPWRSKVLDKARETMQREKPEDYLHIYGGQCRPAVEGAIYYNEVSELKRSGRLCGVPYDPMLKVHVVCDLGFNDYMSLILVQRLASEIRVIRYIEDRMRYIPSYSQELLDLKFNFGKLYLPHDGRAKHVTGSSAEEQFTALGWDVEIVPDIGVEQGIRKTREVFGRLYVDKQNASELVNRLGRYRRRVNAEGQGSTPVHDDESHGADGTRYLAVVADQMVNDTNKRAADPYAGFRRAWAG